MATYQNNPPTPNRIMSPSFQELYYGYLHTRLSPTSHMTTTAKAAWRSELDQRLAGVRGRISAEEIIRLNPWLNAGEHSTIGSRISDLRTIAGGPGYSIRSLPDLDEAYDIERTLDYAKRQKRSFVFGSFVGRERLETAFGNKGKLGKPTIRYTHSWPWSAGPEDLYRDLQGPGAIIQDFLSEGDFQESRELLSTDVSDRIGADWRDEARGAKLRRQERGTVRKRLKGAGFTRFFGRGEIFYNPTNSSVHIYGRTEGDVYQITSNRYRDPTHGVGGRAGMRFRPGGLTEILGAHGVQITSASLRQQGPLFTEAQQLEISRAFRDWGRPAEGPYQGGIDKAFRMGLDRKGPLVDYHWRMARRFGTGEGADVWGGISEMYPILTEYEKRIRGKVDTQINRLRKGGTGLPTDIVEGPLGESLSDLVTRELLSDLTLGKGTQNKISDMARYMEFNEGANRYVLRHMEGSAELAKANAILPLPIDESVAAVLKAMGVDDPNALHELYQDITGVKTPSNLGAFRGRMASLLQRAARAGGEETPQLLEHLIESTDAVIPGTEDLIKSDTIRAVGAMEVDPLDIHEMFGEFRQSHIEKLEDMRGVILALMQKSSPGLSREKAHEKFNRVMGNLRNVVDNTANVDLQRVVWNDAIDELLEYTHRGDKAGSIANNMIRQVAQQTLNAVPYDTQASLMKMLRAGEFPADQELVLDLSTGETITPRLKAALPVEGSDDLFDLYVAAGEPTARQIGEAAPGLKLPRSLAEDANSELVFSVRAQVTDEGISIAKAHSAAVIEAPLSGSSWGAVEKNTNNVNRGIHDAAVAKEQRELAFRHLQLGPEIDERELEKRRMDAEEGRTVRRQLEPQLTPDAMPEMGPQEGALRYEEARYERAVQAAQEAGVAPPPEPEILQAARQRAPGASGPHVPANISDYMGSGPGGAGGAGPASPPGPPPKRSPSSFDGMVDKFKNLPKPAQIALGAIAAGLAVRMLIPRDIEAPPESYPAGGGAGGGYPGYGNGPMSFQAHNRVTMNGTGYLGGNQGESYQIRGRFPAGTNVMGLSQGISSIAGPTSGAFYVRDDRRRSILGDNDSLLQSMLS